MRTERLLMLAVAGVVMLAAMLPVVRGDDAKTEPATAASAPATRSAAVVRGEWTKASAELKKLMDSPAELLDPAKREALAPKVQPLLKRMEGLLAELAAGKPQYPVEVANDTIRVQACLVLLGDAETTKELQTLAVLEDKVGLRAKLTQQLAAWWRASKDEKGQGRVLEAMQQIAADFPRDGRVFNTLMTMKDIGGASEDLSFAAEGVVADKCKGGDADFVKGVHLGRVKQRATMNKPVEFAGPTVEGKDFSTTQYKGKVVLIDFWATWCHPCVAENPRIKALYAKYHEKGLEIVGISCDGDPAKLAAYVKKEEIPWVQMWDKKAQVNDKDDTWHPLATAWGVLSIPQMFLIDREGKLRTVEARENMEEMIPKLLEEK